MLSKCTITSMFNDESISNFDKLTMPSDMILEDVTSSSVSNVSEVLDEFSIASDYRMLKLVVRFMNNLVPMDLIFFFDELLSIENTIFKQHSLDYTPVMKAYIDHKSKINIDYVEFIIGFYKQSNHDLLKDKDFNDSQVKFLVERNKVLIDLLPSIGEKLNKNYYSNYVVSDETSKF